MPGPFGRPVPGDQGDGGYLADGGLKFLGAYRGRLAVPLPTISSPDGWMLGRTTVCEPVEPARPAWSVDRYWAVGGGSAIIPQCDRVSRPGTDQAVQGRICTAIRAWAHQIDIDDAGWGTVQGRRR